MAVRSFSLIGAGRAGGTLAWALVQAGYRPLACFCPTAKGTREAVRFLGGGRAARSLGDAAAAAPLTLIAIPDRLIEPVATELASADLRGRVLLHLSGAQTADALAPARTAGASVAACHPLTSLARRSRNADAFRGVAFAIDGDDKALRAAKALARAVGGRPFLAAREGKVLYHAGAVLASNALVTLLDLARGLARPVGLDDEQALRAFLPLVRATLANVEDLGLEAALTGPVRRGDAATVVRHLEALPRGPVREAYVTLARLSLDLARRAGLDDERAAAIEAVLAGC